MTAQTLAERFQRDGYAFPIQAMAAADALACRAHFEALGERIAAHRLGNKGQVNLAHIVFPFVADIARLPAVLDAVEAVLGPDILLWDSTFFTKEPGTPSYVSWHQDLRYWGLSGDAEVTVWVALGPAREEHGCMRFIPGSHRQGLLAHRDTFAADNFLTRGQEAEAAIDEESAVMVELEPGQASLHHGHLLHASGPNRSGQRRVGLAINYIAPAMRQTEASEGFVVPVRGRDRYRHFRHVPLPEGDLSAAAMAWHRRILAVQNEALYQGAGVRQT